MSIKAKDNEASNSEEGSDSLSLVQTPIRTNSQVLTKTKSYSLVSYKLVSLQTLLSIQML